MSSYICVTSFYSCMMFDKVRISFSGLHSLIDMWVSGIIVGGGLNLGSLFCVGD